MPETPPPEGPPSGAAPEPRPAGPTFEADLRRAREAAGLSLDQIQSETRIPVDVLQRLEEGKLLDDPAFNEIYVRALLKAYGHAVGLPGDAVVQAMEDRQRGRYRGLGAASAGALAPPTPEQGPPAPPPEPAPPPTTAAGAVPVGVVTGGSAPAVEALRARSAAEAAEEAPGKATEPARHRVASHAVARTPRAFDRSWGLIGGGTLVLVLLFSALLWWMFRDRTPRPEPRPGPAVAADTTAAPDTTASSDTTARPPGPAAPRPTAGPRLAIPIRVTVTARGDGLQNFRVTEEPADRLGHWIEPGATRTFTSEQAVVLWGEGAEGLSGEAALELQGVRWAPAEGQVLRIDRATGQRLLDSLATAGTAPAATAPAGTDGDRE